MRSRPGIGIVLSTGNLTLQDCDLQLTLGLPVAWMGLAGRVQPVLVRMGGQQAGPPAVKQFGRKRAVEQCLKLIDYRFEIALKGVDLDFNQRNFDLQFQYGVQGDAAAR